MTAWPGADSADPLASFICWSWVLAGVFALLVLAAILDPD